LGRQITVAIFQVTGKYLMRMAFIGICDIANCHEMSPSKYYRILFFMPSLPGALRVFRDRIIEEVSFVEVGENLWPLRGAEGHQMK